MNIRYEIRQERRGAEVYRWDPSVSRNVLVGQFKLCALKSDKMKLGGDNKWSEVKDWLSKPAGSWWTRCVSPLSVLTWVTNKSIAVHVTL